MEELRITTWIGTLYGAQDSLDEAVMDHNCLQHCRRWLKNLVAGDRVNRMKITDVTTYIVGNPWKNWVFTRVDTMQVCMA
jgi:hypothetical protein